MDEADNKIDPYNAFNATILRVGRILRVEINAKARKPAYKLWIDFGEMGERTSSAQLTDLYSPEDLVGRLIVAVTNLGTRLIAGFRSEVLVMGVADSEGRVVLLTVERDVQPGGRIY